MRKLLFLFLAISVLQLNAAPFKFLPYTITQPNGEVIECFVSGDEFFNWIHDKDGYTIIQAPDGYFYYATKKDDKIVATSFKVNKVKPETIGVKPWTKISLDEYQKRTQRYQGPSSQKSDKPNHAPHTGTLNNIVIYIRFKGEAEFTTTRQAFDDKYNPTTGVSLKSYYTEVSYNNLTISSTHYPSCALTTNRSYQDPLHTRGYFQPYNASTNTIGYASESEAYNREQQLLYDAVTWINANSPVSQSLNIDGDSDGNVDNVCFVIKGGNGAWADLLWAHRSSLYSKTVYINSKKVFDYTFQPESQVEVYTLCHEMFHALGAPDLYHYDTDYRSFVPVGYWDLMEYGFGHMGAYMKWKYAGAKWITTIPEILTSGTYTLNPLTSPTNNCFKIASPNSDKKFFVVEYRKVEGTYEVNLPGSGLIVYRINPDFEGNANFDNVSNFDEVYIYRSGGTVSQNGIVDNAFFSSSSGMTSINSTTSPSSYLHDGLPGGLDISNVTSAGSTISFTVYISDVKAPQNFTATGTSESQINLSWGLNTNNDEVLIATSTTGTIGAPTKGSTYIAGNSIPGGGTVIFAGNATSFNHTSLTSGSNYYYRIWSKNSSNEYSAGVSAKSATYCATPSIPYTQGFNGYELSPCWIAELVTQGQVERAAASITQVKTSAYPDATPSEGSHMIKFNSMDCGVGNIMRLSSPAFSSVGQSQLYLNFSWFRSNGTTELDNVKIQWSTDGATWNDGTSYLRYNSTTGWTQQSYKLPDAALNQNNLKVAFLFTSEFGYNCYLDDVRIESTSTGIDEVNQYNIMIYPNPSKGSFKIKTSNSYKNVIIEVHDICGKLVFKQVFSNSNEASIELTNQPKGLYFITIHADNSTSKQKIVIE